MLNLTEIFKKLQQQSWPLNLCYLREGQQLPGKFLRYRTYAFPRLMIAWEVPLQASYYDGHGKLVELTIASGEALFIPARMYLCCAQPHKILELHFNGSSILLSLNSNFPGEGNQSTTISLEENEQGFQEIELFLGKVALDKNAEDKFKNLYLIKLILLELQRHQLLDEPQNPHSSVAFHKALAYVEGNYSAELSRGQVAGFTGISERHVSHLFRKWTGLKFKELLNLIRLEVFRRSYLHGNFKSKQAAECVGFHDPSHFAQLFKKTYGMSARQFKQSWQSDSSQVELQLTRGFTLFDETAQAIEVDSSCKVAVLIANKSSSEIEVCNANGRRLLSIFADDREIAFCHPGELLQIAEVTTKSFCVPDQPVLILYPGKA